MDYNHERELYYQMTPIGFEMLVHDIIYAYCAISIFVLSFIIFIAYFINHLCTKPQKAIELEPFKDLTSFPNNMYFMSKKNGKLTNSRSTKKTNNRGGGDTRAGTKDVLDNKKNVNFECFICGFKVTLDNKNKLDS